jgi:branched-chain amino acid transport system substrate-binding protein
MSRRFITLALVALGIAATSVSGGTARADQPPLEIGKDSRDIVQTVYIRRTEKRNGQYVNVEIASYPRSTDPLDH